MATATSTRSSALISAAAVLAGLLITVATVVMGSPEAVDRAELSSMDFGFPATAVIQDQSSSDPPLPMARGFESIWEMPTSIDPLGLILDTALWGGVSLVILLLTRRGLSRLRDRGRAELSPSSA